MATVEDFIGARLYDPEADAGTGRLELLQWLDGKGFTVDEMARAQAAESLGALAGDRRLMPGARLSRDAAIEVAQMTPEKFDASVRAFGFTEIDGAPAGEIGITHQEAKAMALIETLGAMFTPDEATSLQRVIGTSLSRIADAAVFMFLADVESRLLLDGSSELDVAATVEEAVGLIDGFAARLDPVLRRHVYQAIERSRSAMINYTERVKYRYAIGFVDLVGFTATSGDMEIAELSRFLREFEGRAHDVVTAAGARLVKFIGDEVMFVASSAAAACVAASELMSGFATADGRVHPRGGLAFGDVLVRGGDYYGSVVNLAARLVNEAVPQELLVTQEAADAADGCSFDAAGRRMVKGFAEAGHGLLASCCSGALTPNVRCRREWMASCSSRCRRRRRLAPGTSGCRRRVPGWWRWCR